MKNQNKKKKVLYGVSSGSYSDYTVHCMHSTKKRAEEWRDQNQPDGYVGEWEINPELAHPKNWRRWIIEIYIGGDVRSEPKLAQSYHFHDNYSKDEGNPDGNFFTFIIGGVNYSEKKIIKIANERRIQILALSGGENNLEDDYVEYEKFGMIDPNKKESEKKLDISPKE